MGLEKGIFNLYERFPKGKRNLITDVPGVKVGQVTIKDPERKIATGVTAILPHSGNLFQQKVMAGSSVINGFGKTVGLVQVEELGTIESPIIMTNTLSVGTALTATVKYLLRENPDIGTKTGTVNCLITECNDSTLNDIRGLHVTEEDVLTAIETAGEDFEEGGVGAGTGMYCLGLKGGIGSSSRLVKLGETTYTIGGMVLANFGMIGHLVIGGDHIGERIHPREDLKEKGSIIILIATDIPLSERQLKRVSKRATISLGRVGSFIGNGSGDIAIAFTTGNMVNHYSDEPILTTKMVHDDELDAVFEATVEAVEESIISALYHGESNLNGNTRKEVFGLKEYL